MPLQAPKSGGGGRPGEQRPLPREGAHNAVCAFITDIGEEHFRGKWQHKLVMCFELEQQLEDRGPFMLSETVTFSMFSPGEGQEGLSKARLCGYAENLKGRMLPIAEMANPAGFWVGQGPDEAVYVALPYAWTSDEEREEFDVETLVGQPCTLLIQHVMKKDGTGHMRAAINAVLPHCPTAKKLAVKNEGPPKWVGEQKAKNQAAKAAPTPEGEVAS